MNLHAAIDRFFADRHVIKALEATKETRPLQICFPNEISISRFLAWILDASQGHGMHDAVLRRMLSTAWQSSADVEIGAVTRRTIAPAYWSTRSFSGSIIQREVRFNRGQSRLDVLILLPHEKLLIAVENKFGAREGKDQLKRYRDALAERFPEWDRLHLFLDVYGEVPSGDGWISLDYEWLVEELRIAEESAWLGDEPRRTIREFREAIDIGEDKFSSRGLDERHLVPMVKAHALVFTQMATWIRSRKSMLDLTNEIYSVRNPTLNDKALQQLLPAFAQRLALWRQCVAMLSHAGLTDAAAQEFKDLRVHPKRTAFYFSLESWSALEKGEDYLFAYVMVRLLPENEQEAERFVVLSTVDFDELKDDYIDDMRVLAEEMRGKYLKRQHKLTDELGRVTLRVQHAENEAEAARLLISHLKVLDQYLTRLRTPSV